MRSLTDMISRTRTWVKDADGFQWTAAQVKVALQDAADSVWNLLLDDPLGKDVLRKVSADQSFVANQQEYSLPTDCLRVISVEFRMTSNQIFWQLQHQAPETNSAAYVSGNDNLFSGFQNLTRFWYDRDVARGKVRIWPAPISDTSSKWRIWYYHKPVFPALDSGAFSGVPDGVDAMCEFLAAANLSLEELEDGKPVGAFGQMFRAKFGEYCRAAKQVERPRRYVRQVS